MFETFRLSWRLKNTCHTNAVIYAIRALPLIGRRLPPNLYSLRGLKRFAGVIAALGEFVSTFLGKAAFLLMIYGLGALYESVPAPRLFLHLFLLLSLVGALLNTYLFAPTNEKYVAIALLRMDAGRYTHASYCYAMLRLLGGYLPFVFLFGLARDVPPVLCLLAPFCAAGAKMAVAGVHLVRYDRTGICPNENTPGRQIWITLGALCLLAFGLPVLGYALPLPLLLGLMGLMLAGGVWGALRIRRFSGWRALNWELLQKRYSAADVRKNAREQTRARTLGFVEDDGSITSRRTGFAYLNELFVRRHRRILWSAAKKQAAVLLGLGAAAVAAARIRPELGTAVHTALPELLPTLLFVMYILNRGTSFTQALFMNCDYALLTYPFFKRPRSILQLFRIRLWEIVKINLLPAGALAAAVTALLFLSGGPVRWIDAVMLPLSILLMSVFFSVHYLTLYYLLQPYTVSTELKSGAYKLAVWLTYFACLIPMQLRLPPLAFGLGLCAFCLLYCLVACLLVWRFAAQTFRLRT